MREAMKERNMNADEFGLISVIMAAYNAENTVASAIKSVLGQTYQNFELLIIDDGSSDLTAAIVKDFAVRDERIRLIANAQNSGVSASRKNGLAAARGGWIAILDSDDLWRPDKLEKQIALQRKTGADLLFTGSAFIDAQGRPKTWILHVPETIDYRALLKQNLISNSSTLVKKDLAVQFYVQNDRIHEDYALWLRILRGGKIAYGLDEPLLVYRLQSASKSGNKLKSALMNWRTYRYVGLSAPESAYYMFRYALNGIMKYRNFF